MKRRLITIMVFLLAGAVLDVAVAWQSWRSVEGQVSYRMYRFRLGFDRPWGAEFDFLDLPLVSVQLGWPSPSWRGTSDLVMRSQMPGAGATLEQFLSDIRPIWPGFIINAFLYGAFLWLALCGPFVLRRYRRAKRGLCPNCAYPVGRSPVCTECGGALPTRAVA